MKSMASLSPGAIPVIKRSVALDTSQLHLDVVRLVQTVWIVRRIAKFDVNFIQSTFHMYFYQSQEAKHELGDYTVLFLSWLGSLFG